MAELSNIDGLLNVATGLGTRAYDPTLRTTITPTVALQRVTANALYRESGILRKVVEIYPDAMTHRWGKINIGGKKADQELQEEVTKLLDGLSVSSRFFDGMGVRHAFNWCQKQANLHGNASAVMIFQGDRLEKSSLAQPVPKVPRPLVGLFLLDRWEMYPIITSIQNRWTIARFQIASQVLTAEVDSSRVLWFRGAELPNEELLSNQGCDDSVINPLLESYYAMESALRNADRMMHNSGQRRHGISGLLRDLETRGEEYEKFLCDRMMVNEIGSSNYRTVVYDKDEEDISFLERSNLSGVKDILDTFIDHVVANSDLTRGQLLGQFAGGILTAGSDAERSQINQSVASKQSAKLGSNLNKLLRIILSSTQFRRPDLEFSWQWLPYIVPTEDEEISRRGQIISQAVQANQISPALAQNILLSAFSPAELNINLTLDPRVKKIIDATINQLKMAQEQEIEQAKKEAELLAQEEEENAEEPEEEALPVEEEPTEELTEEPTEALTEEPTEDLAEEPEEGAELESSPETALNGAQIKSLVDVIKSVALGEIPRDAGIEVLALAFNIQPEQAERLMGSVGGGFTPKSKAAN